MIRDIAKLKAGLYAGDFRWDEGLRINEKGISPCLPSHQYRADNSLSGVIYVFEVTDEDKTRHSAGVD